MTESLRRRARSICERELVRAWEYRQRGYSHGVWYRLRRVLVDAAEAWILPESEADRLEREGYAPHSVGRELAPPKRIFFVSGAALQGMAGRTSVPVRLSAELLGARSLALVPHRERADAPQAPNLSFGLRSGS